MAAHEHRAMGPEGWQRLAEQLELEATVVAPCLDQAARWLEGCTSDGCGASWTSGAGRG